MKAGRAIVVAVAIAGSLVMSGCKKKKPPLPPPQATAPTITQPATTTEPVNVEPQPAPPQPQPSKPAPAVTKPKPKPKPRNTTVAKKPSAAVPAGEKSRVIIDEGGKTEQPNPTLSAELSQDSTAHQQLSTVQLLQSAEYNLSNIKRALTADEQAMVQHVRSYIEQSRQATKAGDMTMAYNLAVKAHLMSDSLAKH